MAQQQPIRQPARHTIGPPQRRNGRRLAEAPRGLSRLTTLGTSSNILDGGRPREAFAAESNADIPAPMAADVVGRT